MTGDDNTTPVSLTGTDGATPVGSADVWWARQLQQVPKSWRTLIYRIDTAPANTVFLHNPRYLNNPDGHDFTPTVVPQRFCQEMAWWVWLCGHDGIRKIEPSLLKWCGRALTDEVAEYRQQHHRWPASIADLPVDAIVRHAVIGFERRNKRLPSAGARRYVTSFIEHLHLYVSVRCTDKPWWAHDVWDLRADPRIPQREHEPCHDRVVKLSGIQPLWLREGVRFWLRTSLTGELLRWSSVAERARDMARQLGPFLAARDITDPLITHDRAALRLLFTEFSDYLKSPQAAATPGRPLSPSAIHATQSQTQVFYAFMVDHAEEAATATGDPRWAQITDTYTRLWGAAFRTRRANRVRELTWYSTAELQQMLCYLDVLAADVGAPVAITHPDTTISSSPGWAIPRPPGCGCCKR